MVSLAISAAAQPTGINGVGANFFAGCKLLAKPSRWSFNPTKYRAAPVFAKCGDKSLFFDLENMDNTTGKWDSYCSDAQFQSMYSSSSSARWGSCRRRALVFGIGAWTVNPFSMSSGLAEKPKNYEAFVDKVDGYSYYYPSDWRDFDFRGHDSSFKDRYMQLHNVRLSFIPTDKTDIHDLGPIEEVVANLVTNVYSAPNQVATILDVQEKNIEGRNYCTFEYILTSPNFARAAFATIAIGNGKYYTLVVGANERRWKRFRTQLKVVADSFKVLDV